MSNARRMIGLSAFVALVGLGTGWALGTTLSNSRMQTGTAASESAMASQAVNAQPTDSSQEDDRSDLLLSQG